MLCYFFNRTAKRIANTRFQRNRRNGLPSFVTGQKNTGFYRKMVTKKENTMNKKYLPSALILYLNYFIHGIGCSILGQAVIKECPGSMPGAWKPWPSQRFPQHSGLGRLIALPFAGPLSDKLGRRISTAIGSASYADLSDRPCPRIRRRHQRRLHDRLRVRNHRRYRQLLPGHRYLPGSRLRSSTRAPGVATMGIKFFHRDRTDAPAIRTWRGSNHHRCRTDIPTIRIIHRLRYHATSHCLVLVSSLPAS